MRVLVACEYSGIVRDEFIKLGHDAVSCDLLDSESDFGEHYKGNVLDIVNDGWDMMIAFPPCTYLTVSGAMWYTILMTKIYLMSTGDHIQNIHTEENIKHKH